MTEFNKAVSGRYDLREKSRLTDALATYKLAFSSYAKSLREALHTVAAADADGLFDTTMDKATKRFWSNLELAAELFCAWLVQVKRVDPDDLRRLGVPKEEEKNWLIEVEAYTRQDRDAIKKLLPNIQNKDSNAYKNAEHITEFEDEEFIMLLHAALNNGEIVI